MNPPPSPDADWLKPAEEQASLERYVETVRERLWLILAIVLVTTGAAVAYVATAEKTYEAEANLLITPADSGNPISGSLGLVQASVDPTRDVETASRLVENTDVAARVAERLGVDREPQELLGDVTAQPVAQSSIVAITAEASSPEAAKQLADAFAEEVVAYRTEQMHEQIDAQLPRLREQAVTADEIGEESIQAQIAQLELLRSGPDPTMRVEALASEPHTPTSPRPVLSVAAGVFAGVVLGLAAAFSAQMLDPRLRRESQLRRRFSLPILGRIPKETARNGDWPLDPRGISPVTAEAYRTLRSTLTGSLPRSADGGKVLFITGSAPSEGKTSTTLNLASSFAISGRRVIVIESDLRRPVISETLGVTALPGGVVSVLLENTTLEQSLVQVDAYGPSLQFLLADYEGGWITELFAIPSAQRMLERARQLADIVIVDSPPLNEVVDALPLAEQADEVLIVARLGLTRLDRLAVLSELMAESGIRPAGFAVVGTPRPKRDEYHYYTGGGGAGSKEGRHRKSGGGSPRPLLAASGAGDGQTGLPRID